MALQEAELFEDQHPLIRSCSALNEIRLAQDIKDLTIEVRDGDILHVHRIVLAARIPSLRASLSGPLAEENSVLRWPTTPLSLANALVQYVYTGRVEMTQDNVMGMIVLARMLKLPTLVNWGVTYMTKRVNLENLPATWDFAKSFNIKLLADTCTGLMEEHFKDFVPTELFVRLPAETVLSLLRSDRLSVGSEEEVVAAIARWAGAGAGGQADDEKLKVHAPAMLKEVQWQLTTVEFRDCLMENYPIFRENPECFRLLLQAERWIAAADKDKPARPFNLRPPLRRTVFLLFGEDKDQDRWSVLRADQHLQQAERVADMKPDRWFASYSVVDESIFVVGGQGDCRGLVDVDEFLVREGRWRERAPLAVRRQQHAAAVVKVHAVDGEEALIGVFGGCFKEGDSWTHLSSCEVYDVSQNRCHKLPDLPEKRVGPAAACLPGDSRVFVFGGWHGLSSQLASVVFCNLRADWREEATSARTADFWQPAAAMRTARSGLAATPFRGAILVAGGHDGQSDFSVDVVEIFSPPDAGSPLGQWTMLAGMKAPRRGFTLLTSVNAIFALGNSHEPSNTVETLTAPGGSADFVNDLTSWVWSSKSPVETLEDIAGAASVRI
ncbi:BTB And C-terminal Kelch [Sparganum proliferum]